MSDSPAELEREQDHIRRKPSVPDASALEEVLRKTRTEVLKALPTRGQPSDLGSICSVMPALRDAYGATDAYLIEVWRERDGGLWPNDDAPLRQDRFRVAACVPVCKHDCEQSPTDGSCCQLDGLPPVLREAVVTGASRFHEEEHAWRGRGRREARSLWTYWLTARIALPEGQFLLALASEPADDSLTSGTPFASAPSRDALAHIAGMVGEGIARAGLAHCYAHYQRALRDGPSLDLANAAEKLLLHYAWFAFRNQAVSRGQNGEFDISGWLRDPVTVAPADTALEANLHLDDGLDGTGLSVDDIIADYLSSLLYEAREATARARSAGNAYARRLWRRLGRALTHIPADGAEKGEFKNPEVPGAEPRTLTVHLPWHPPPQRPGDPEPKAGRGPRLEVALEPAKEFLRTRMAAGTCFFWLSHAIRRGLWGRPPDWVALVDPFKKVAEHLAGPARKGIPDEPNLMRLCTRVAARAAVIQQGGPVFGAHDTSPRGANDAAHVCADALRKLAPSARKLLEEACQPRPGTLWARVDTNWLNAWLLLQILDDATLDKLLPPDGAKGSAALPHGADAVLRLVESACTLLRYAIFNSVVPALRDRDEYRNAATPISTEPPLTPHGPREAAPGNRARPRPRRAPHRAPLLLPGEQLPHRAGSLRGP